jgi:SPP1 gp7 family putative phage head morphogenesis protein
VTVQETARQGRIYQQAAQFQRELALSQSAAQDQILASWARAYERIRVEYQGILDQVAEAHAEGRPIKPAWLYQQERLANAEATARAELARYAKEARQATLSAEQAAIGASARHHAALGEEALAQANLAATFVQVNPDNLRHLAGTLADGSPLADLFNGMAEEVASQARDALLQGIALGKGPAWMAQQIAPALDMPRHRAVTIMRTETQRVYRETARETYMANADVLQGWVWTATLTSRTCGACISMHGTIHPVTETLDGHPRCRCAMVPRTPSWADLGVEGVEDNRPPLESGKDWLEAQPEKVQRAILGNAKHRAWKDGEITLDDVVARTHDPAWGSMRRERSLVEIREGRNANTLPSAPAKAPPRHAAPSAPAQDTLLAPEQYEALRPSKSGWSEAKRASILDALRATPEGKTLAQTLESFQDGGSIARLRGKMDKHLAGEAVDATSAARADALLGAIRDAPTDWAPDTLYRGMSVKGSLENVLAKYQPGDDLDLTLTSFSSDRGVAKRFQDMTAKGKDTRVMVELVGEGKRVLPIQDLPKDRRLWREKEWVTAGRYEIVEAKKAPGGGILLRIRQKGTL